MGSPVCSYKYRLPLVRQALPGPINSEPYHIHLPDSFYSALQEPKELRSRPRNVESLRRYWGTTPKWWPVPDETDCAWPLYLYYQALKECGQMNVAQEIYYFLSKVMSSWNRRCRRTGMSEPSLYVEDYIRHMLKQLSAYSFPRIFSDGPAFMLLCHLHALNAKAPYKRETIIAEITDWVSASLNGRKKEIHMPTFKRVLKETVSKWQKYTHDSLSYEEFANDPFRWGTSGGAPAVNMHGTKLRSKWAWAISQKIDEKKGYMDGVDLNKRACSAQSMARIALKEESQKTREIITTPIASYLRQTYLMYLLGKAPIPSPISSPAWLPSFEEGNYSWYGCIDGERFDHTVPKEAIICLLDELGTISPEARKVADEEIKHIQNLKIEWSGRVWKYEGGLLSGWRFTSVLGSIISLSAAEYVVTKTNTKGAVQYGVMGDDVVFYSNVASIPPADMVKYYNEFGLRANIHKTSSGEQGEFLRKVRSKGGSWAFPALDLKTITHAAPWITSFQFVQEEECATAWHTLTSRLLPHATDPNRIANWSQKHNISDLNRSFGRSYDWQAWLKTPMTAGGGGYVENSSPSVWTTISKQKSAPHLTPYEKLGQLVGTLPSKRTIKKIVLEEHQLAKIRLLEERTNVTEHLEFIPRFKRTANITKTMWRILNNDMSVSELNTQLVTHLPHRMRMYSGARLASLLSTASKTISSIPSIVHTKEAMPVASRTLTMLTKQLMARRSGIPSTMAKPLATLFAINHYKDTVISYGTW